MSDAFEFDEQMPSETPSRPTGHPVVAWIVILLCVAALLLAPEVLPERAQLSQGRLSLVLTTMFARYLVGATSFVGENSALIAQAETLNTGPLPQRWRAIALVAELQGPKAALESLGQLQQELKAKSVEETATDKEIHGILDRLYRDYDQKHLQAPSVNPANRELLRRELGWFGDLALAPADGTDAAARQAVLRGAQQTFLVIIGGGALAVVACLAGLLWLVVFAVLLLTGQLHGGLGTSSGNGGVYAETFALYLLLTIGLGLAGALLPAGESSLLYAGLAILLSMIALAWPVVRGIPWVEVRRDIGLVAGRQPAVEPIIGAGCYAMALPLMVVGLAITFILVAHAGGLGAAGPPEDSFAPSPTPAHPIVGYMATGSGWLRFQVFFLACIVAPVVEETFFRGVLYRHLREASRRLGSIVSIVLSATVMNFVFAGLHPQGLLAIPPLMALAYGLTIAREWRGTLVPGMVAHGINNGLVLLFLTLATGG